MAGWLIVVVADSVAEVGAGGALPPSFLLSRATLCEHAGLAGDFVGVGRRCPFAAAGNGVRLVWWADSASLRSAELSASGQAASCPKTAPNIQAVPPPRRKTVSTAQ